jgi:NAD dependent epimerase/dehydratase family enzyme
MRKIVIAGGTGFLGSCLAQHFVQSNDRVIILTRGASRTDSRALEAPGPD